ncbi:preprotein translocase subunit SecA [Kiritimatiellaeota bacterium B1221]|nr:preprotein translocase subunit SecA [Kiritimatiellaeota bacterium B1221]
MKWLLKKIVGSKNDRDLKRLRPLVARINELEESYQQLSEAELKAKTDEFKARLKEGESTDDLLPEAFAVVKNACRRLVGTEYEVSGTMRTWVEIPYDVQMIGGMAMHQGRIAEMATGEGKTLVATAPAYLNALTGDGVHVVTVNDYLAMRDSEWMGLVFDYLGLTVGCIQSGMHPIERREKYAQDITYGTNAEFGFDYLRDNMTYTPAERVQRGHNFAIIDEIDSILVDEARTPLIISGPTEHSSEALFLSIKPMVQRLVKQQRQLLDGFVNDIKTELAKPEKEQDSDSIQKNLYRVHQGMPKHPALLSLLEDHDVRRKLEKVNDQFLTETFKELARELRQDLYFTVDEKSNDAGLTDKGTEAISPQDPDAYVLPDLATIMSELDGNEEMSDEERVERRRSAQEEFADKSESIHAIDQLIRAYTNYEKDVHYVVQDNQVVIVDENTGRLMTGRRWSDGLHQAVEAKEGVKIERETQTLATVTIQNYFRMYDKLSGMTGTAETEAEEFMQIYKLDVLVIPTNRPVRRVDLNDRIYRTRREKFNAVVAEITEAYRNKQPVLVGTVTVESSEELSRLLMKKNIPHNVLNAKNHGREADIVARAGQPGAITIATNMAGRGTDIKLGEGVVKMDREEVLSQMSLSDKKEGMTLAKWIEENPCGLYVIGTERHESRRIDRQLRGRCSRQGDPGMSCFYVSLEDDLMRLFGAERISNIMSKLGIEEGEVMEHKWLNKSVERAQRRVEQYHFGIRKRTLEYDDVMNRQREVVYGLRTEILTGDNPRAHLLDMISDVIDERAVGCVEQGEEIAPVEFADWCSITFPVTLRPDDLRELPLEATAYADVAIEEVKKAYDLKIQSEPPESVQNMERHILLKAIDTHWQEYLRGMDALRQGVGLRAYGQKDPILEFKHEAYAMFADLMQKINDEVAQRAFRATTSLEALEKFLKNLKTMESHSQSSAFGKEAQARATSARQQSEQQAKMEKQLEQSIRTPQVRELPKVGRNDPCPCGSGKKYKQCCGQ